MDKLKLFLNKHYIKIVVILFSLAFVSGVLAITLGQDKKTEDVAVTETVIPKKTERPAELKTAKPNKETDAPKKDEASETTEAAEEIDEVRELEETVTKKNDSQKNKTVNTSKEDNKTVCTISVNCGEVRENMSDLDPQKQGIIPSDGWMLKPTKAEFEEGESAFDVLERILKKQKIHFEFVKTPAYNSVYIEGIGNLYEFDCGPTSGWRYKVNGEMPMVGCSEYILKAGDTIEFEYTCDYGADYAE